MKTKEANIAYNFYKNSRQFSSRPALNIKGKTYNYNQINKLANLISNEIYNIDSKSKFISMLINKELEAYIGILGILYSGKAYVPLSVKFPLNRLLTMLNSTPSDIMIVSTESMVVFKELLPLINKKMTFIFFGKEITKFKKKYSKTKVTIFGVIGAFMLILGLFISVVGDEEAASGVMVWGLIFGGVAFWMSKQLKKEPKMDSYFRLMLSGGSREFKFDKSGDNAAQVADFINKVEDTLTAYDKK